MSRRRRPQRTELPPPGSPERTAANREIGRAWRALKMGRTLHITAAVVFGLVGLFSLNEGGVYLIVAAILLPACALSAVGAAVLLKSPKAWSLAIAIVTSVLIFPVYLLSRNILTIALAAIPIGCWVAYAQVAHAVPIMERYPDLRIAKRMRGEATARRPGSTRR